MNATIRLSDKHGPTAPDPTSNAGRTLSSSGPLGTQSTLGPESTLAAMEALAAVPEGEAMPSKDCAQLLRVSSDLYLLDDSANLPAQLLRSLGTLVPHELGGCHWIEPSQQHIAAFYDPAFPELDCPNNQKSYKNFWQLAENHPLHDLLFSHPMRAWKLSDVISRRAFQET